MTNNDTNRSDTAPADRDWFGGRRWTGIAAVGVIILIALCVVIVLAINRGGSGVGNSATGTPSTPAQTSGPVSSSANNTAAALPTAVPTKAPAGTTWSIYQTFALPSVTGAGPAKVSGSIATGYAHSPAGALLAVANEGQRYELAPDTEWRKAAAAMLAPGAGTSAWIKVRGKNPYGAAGAAGSDTLLQIAGFQFVSYTPSDAVVQIVNGDPNSGYQVGVDHVTWDGTDWKFAPAADGGPEANVQQVNSLAGFIPWRGV